MDLIYRTIITDIGKNASDFLEHNMLIIFQTELPEELKDYCYIHNENNLVKDIEVGDILYLGEDGYRITAVGDVVNENLNTIGHITFKFEGETIAGPSGTLHLEKKEIAPLKKGTIIKIVREK